MYHPDPQNHRSGVSKDEGLRSTLPSTRVVLTRSPTRDNAANLAPGWVEAMEEAYRGSHLLAQELEGVLVDDLPGAMFSRPLIEKWREAPFETPPSAGPQGKAPQLFERVVVAVDPPAGENGVCGIVCAGLRDGVVHVLEDASVRGLRPLQWAGRVAGVAKRRGAGTIVAEANQGGEMVRDVLRVAGCEEASRVRLRSATQSKRDRAEPVSGRYEQGLVRHAGVFRELEDEMCAFGAAGAPARSPDRVDALVWAVRELTDPRVLPKVESLWE
jgi:phage terminase large subunit-like protein